MQFTWTMTAAMAAAALAVLAWGQNLDRAEVALHAAMKKESVDGDLKAAIEQYKKLAQGGNKPVAAQALVRLGECYEKQGNADARKTYEQVLSKFGDQTEAVAQARARLAAMGKPASGLSPRLIAKDGWVVGPSPDGRFLLLESGTEGDLDLRDLQTGQIRHIAKNTWGEAGVSPDGRQVAFLRCTDDVCQLRIVGADGSAERLLWQPDKGWGVSGVQWFPDGRRIMVTVWPGNGVGRVVAVSAADGAATTLLEGKGFTIAQLSPDGKSVVYTRRGELWLARLEDRSESLLFEGQYYVGSPRWTPDGAGVVFLSDQRVPGTTLDLWLLRTSSGKPLGIPELLKTGLGEMANGQPTTFARGTITRDGTYYFHREQSGDMVQLLTTKFDPDTGKAVGAPSFVSRKGGMTRGPSFSRDGRWLAYVWQGQSLVIQSLESGEERVVPMTPSPAQLNWAVMFPDGRSVLVDAVHPANKKGLYKVDVASGVWTSLKKPGEGEVTGWPNAISPDGRIVYLNRGTVGGYSRSDVIARDIETGQERKLVQGSGLSALSFDGKQLAVGRLTRRTW